MKKKWCLQHDKMVDVQDGVLGQLHIIEGPELDWCEGPFVDAEPAQDEVVVVFDLCNSNNPMP